jgi:hypothetical protein
MLKTIERTIYNATHRIDLISIRKDGAELTRHVFKERVSGKTETKGRER